MRDGDWPQMRGPIGCVTTLTGGFQDALFPCIEFSKAEEQLADHLELERASERVSGGCSSV